MSGEPPEPHRPLMGWVFWTALAFGLACVLAGLAVALFAPHAHPGLSPPTTVEARPS